MNDRSAYMNRLLEWAVELLDVPASHYRLAIERYESLGRWFHREGSQLAHLEPAISPQGSFRLGTVIRPLLREDEYDLDLVCRVALTKAQTTQQQLKQLVGEEVMAYAEAHGMKEPPIERKRCWRMDYADDVSFHMDILPAIPDDEAVKQLMAGLGVPADYTEHAIAITDKTRLDYARITKDWPRSNPEGFARWFEDRMRQGPMNRAMVLVREGVYASIDDVPAHERKTVLQRVVQILKRHRDVMFRDDCELKPISVIISTLSAEAYAGQASLYEGLSDVIAAMPGLVRRGRPRIPSPVNPAEDFADKWVAKPELERNFWAWHTQLQRDLQRLADATGSETRRSLVETAFALSISPDELRAMGGAAAEGEASMPPYVHVASGPKPWAQRA